MSRTRPNSRRAGAAGFTLLELMLAVVILGLILATVYGALSRTTFSKEIAEDRAEVFSNGRQVVLKMAGDIEAALPPPSGDRLYFRGVGDARQAPSGQAPIEFAIMNRGGYGANHVRPGRVLIAYSLVPLSGLRGSFALQREEFLFSALLAETDGAQPPPPEDGEDPAPTQQVTVMLDCPNVPDELNLPGSCMRVTSLRFRYYDEVARSWSDEWDSTQDATLDRLPAAVEIALLVADKKGNEFDFGTIVDLPLARGQPTPEATTAGAPAGQAPTNPTPPI